MKKIYKFMLIIFFLMMIGSIISLIIWNKYNTKNKNIVKKEEKYLKKEKEIYYLDKEILNDNPNTIGWIIVKGTNINYPVVQYTDNKYYLNHDFYNETNSAGWIFMDYKNELDDENLVIYGHHRTDGSMFGSIDLLFDKKFYQENNEIILITEKNMYKYEIFSVYKTNSDDNYTNNNFENLEQQMNILKEKSEIKIENSEIKYEQIITLSTCHNNNSDRLVIHGYKKN